jgi:hypothetical protein
MAPTKTLIVDLLSGSGRASVAAGAGTSPRREKPLLGCYLYIDGKAHDVTYDLGSEFESTCSVP